MQQLCLSNIGGEFPVIHTTGALDFIVTAVLEALWHCGLVTIFARNTHVTAVSIKQRSGIFSHSIDWGPSCPRHQRAEVLDTTAGLPTV
jgi:hypothetical protein